MPRSSTVAGQVPDLEQLFSELAALRANLEHAQRLATLGTIAGLIAHEFNNILTPVMSYAQMALATPNDAALTKKALEHAASGSERAAQIATAILDFARQDLQVTDGPHSGLVWRGENAPSSNGSHADVGACIRLVFECIARNPARDSIKLEVSCPPGLPEAAIRPVALQQVLMNLVLNARRAMAAGGGTLQVRAQATGRPQPPTDAAVATSERVSAVSKWVAIAVQDSGPGIARARMSSLFKPFATSGGSGGGGRDGGDGTSQRGNGLGLVVCRQLVAQAGGMLWAESVPGSGATFTAAIPAAI